MQKKHVFMGAFLVLASFSAAGNVTWVSYEFTAGQQCQEAVPEPDPLAPLQKVGVQPLFHSCESQAVCRACGCPQHRLECRYLVRHQDVETLTAVGFTKTEPYTSGRYYLMATDGEQCTLAEDNEPVLTEEITRLESRDASIHYLTVSSILRDDLVPKWCVPTDTDDFFRAYPWAAAGVQFSGGAVCEACGCPETWFYCLESSSDPTLLKELGYAPLR